MKTHFKFIEKMRMLQAAGLYYEQAKKVSNACDNMTFEKLNRLAKVIKQFAKGK